ncbi:unnamed protein product [Ixodes pacificus]
MAVGIITQTGRRRTPSVIERPCYSTSWWRWWTSETSSSSTSTRRRKRSKRTR